jgi:hypothetical protein
MKNNSSISEKVPSHERRDLLHRTPNRNDRSGEMGRQNNYPMRNEQPRPANTPSIHNRNNPGQQIPAQQRNYGGTPMNYGYGMYGMGPYGGYGMNSLYSGPMMYIQSFNYFIMSIGHFFDLIGVSSHALIEGIYAIGKMLKDLEMKIRTSEFRRWLQQKSKKSKLLRFLFILSSMAIAVQLSKLLKFLIAKYLSSYISLQDERPTIRNA